MKTNKQKSASTTVIKKRTITVIFQRKIVIPERRKTISWIQWLPRICKPSACSRRNAVALLPPVSDACRAVSCHTSSTVFCFDRWHWTWPPVQHVLDSVTRLASCWMDQRLNSLWRGITHPFPLPQGWNIIRLLGLHHNEEKLSPQLSCLRFCHLKAVSINSTCIVPHNVCFGFEIAITFNRRKHLKHNNVYQNMKSKRCLPCRVYKWNKWARDFTQLPPKCLSWSVDKFVNVHVPDAWK